MSSLRQAADQIREQENLKKHFETDDLKFLFDKVDYDLRQQVPIVLENSHGATIEVYLAIEEYLLALREILAIIVDQPYVCHFKSSDLIIALVRFAKKATTVLSSIAVITLLLDASNRQSNTSKAIIFKNEDKVSILRYISIIAGGFNVFTETYVSFYKLATKEIDIANHCSHITAKNPQDGLSKVTLDIDSLLTIWQSTPACSEKIAQFLKYHLGDFETHLKVVYTDALLWRCQLANLVQRTDLNSLEDVFVLILNSKSNARNSAQANPLDFKLGLLNEVVTSTPQGELLEVLEELLKLPTSSTFHAAAIRHYCEIHPFSHSESINNRVKLLADLLADFNHDTLRRRSSGTITGGQMDVEKGSISKDSELLKEVLVQTKATLQVINMREEGIREKCNFTELIISIFDNSLSRREDDSLLLQYSPDCYVQGYKTLAGETTLISQILKEADSFVDALLCSKEIHYVKKGVIVKVQSKERDQIVVEVLNTMIVFMNDDLTPAGSQVQLQAMVGDIATLKLWKLCFSTDSQVSPTIKGLAHKVLVGFFDELPQQYLVQTSDKFISEGVVEGLFNFVWSKDSSELQIYLNSIYLISRLVVNKKIERYVTEADVIRKLLRSLMNREVFLKTYMHKGKDHLCNHFTTVAEALFDIANTSPECSRLLESVILELIDTFAAVCGQVSATYQHYLITGVFPSMIDERLLVWSGYVPSTPLEIGRYFSFFEEYSQIFLHFFRKFLDVEASNLTVKILEKGYMEKVMGIFLEFGLPCWNSIIERSQIFIEIFSNLSYQGATASKVQITFLKEKCLPKLIELFEAVKGDLENIDDSAINSCLELVTRQTPNNPLPASVLKRGFTPQGCAFIQDYTRIALICSVCTNGGIAPVFSAQANFVSEGEYLRLVDIYVGCLNERLFPLQTPIALQLMRDAVAGINAPETVLTLNKELREELSAIRAQNLLFKIAVTLLNLFNSQFAANQKLASQVFARLGAVRGPPSLETGGDFAAQVLQHFELMSLTAPFVASLEPPSATSLVAVFESGLFATLAHACTQLVTLVSAFLVLVKSEQKTVDHVIVTVTLNHRMGNVLQDSIFAILNKAITPQDKFYRDGALLNKTVGSGKARYVKLKAYESLNNLVLGILKGKSEHYVATKIKADEYRPSLQSSGVFHGRIDKDATEKIKTSYRELLVQFLKMAISLQVKDSFSDERGGQERTRNQVPRVVVNKLMEIGFDEARIKIAGTKVRNPSDFNEMCEWLLNNPDVVEAPGAEKMDEEAPQTTTNQQDISKLLDCPTKDPTEYKAERVEQYKRFCQTLIRYFLFIPKTVDFVGLLSNYTTHVHDNSNSAKSSRQFLFDLYYLFVDFLILLRTQLSKLKPGQDIDTVDISLPAKFNKVKVVNTHYTRLAQPRSS
jgi:hypothetical protein